MLREIKKIGSKITELETRIENNRLKYVDGYNIARVQIVDGYVKVPDIDGIHPIFATSAYFGSCTGCFSIICIADGRVYVVGDNGTIITDLTVRYWYL